MHPKGHKHGAGAVPEVMQLLSPDGETLIMGNPESTG